MRIRSATAGRGYSLIEIVVIIVVAAIILPAIIMPFVNGVRDLRLPVLRGTMTLLAQEEMEKKVIPLTYYYVVAWASTPISGFPDFASTGDVIWVEPGAFNTETDGDSGYKRVTVTIDSEGYSLALTTIKTDWTETE